MRRGVPLTEARFCVEVERAVIFFLDRLNEVVGGETTVELVNTTGEVTTEQEAHKPPRRVLIRRMLQQVVHLDLGFLVALLDKRRDGTVLGRALHLQCWASSEI